MMDPSGDVAGVQVEDPPPPPLASDPETAPVRASVAHGEGPVRPPAEENALSRRLEELPKDVGAMLVAVGVCGVVLPGMAGVPAIVAGGLVLWPKAFGRVDRWLQRRHAGLYQRGVEQVDRYLNDLGRRYPAGSKPGPTT